MEASSHCYFPHSGFIFLFPICFPFLFILPFLVSSFCPSLRCHSVFSRVSPQVSHARTHTPRTLQCTGQFPAPTHTVITLCSHVCHRSPTSEAAATNDSSVQSLHTTTDSSTAYQTSALPTKYSSREGPEHEQRIISHREQDPSPGVGQQRAERAAALGVASADADIPHAAGHRGERLFETISRMEGSGGGDRC